MAPEQAEGKTKEVGALADVYALGSILYELLTGRPPFRAATMLETLTNVKSAEPAQPSRLVPGLPRDLETIALKCLQKDPAKRYVSALSLAEDLRRFLGGEPIVARPVGFVERAWRWCRRNPAAAALTATIVLVAALGLAGVIWQWSEAVKARDLASRRAIQAETTLVDMYTVNGVQAGDQGENGRAALWFANAALQAQADPERQRANVIRVRTWGRRAFTPLRAFVADGSWPWALVFHPEGRHLMAQRIVDGNTRDVSNTLWDLNTEQPLLFPGGLKEAPAAAWSPDGRTLAVGHLDGDVIITSFPGAQEVVRIPFLGRIRLLTYSADGNYLAIAGGSSARVWDCRTAAFATPELAHPAAVKTLTFHPEDRYLATSCGDDRARLFAVPSDTPVPIWPAVPHLLPASRNETDLWYCSPPLFVNGGKGLITYGGKRGLTWRALDTGAEIRTLDSPEFSARMGASILSPDGRYLAAYSVQYPSCVHLFDVATGQPVGPALWHKNNVFSMSFSPDSLTLLTGSSDNTVQLWAVPSGEPLSGPLDLHRSVNLVAFGPDGRSLATQDGDLVRLWELPQEGLPIARVHIDSNHSFVALSPDGALAVPTGMSFPTRSLTSTRACSVATGEAAGPALRTAGLIVDAIFSPDGKSIATLDARSVPTSEAQELQVWDWMSGQRTWHAALPAEPRSVSYRPDGRRLAVLCANGELLIFDASSGQVALHWQLQAAELVATAWINNGKVQFSPNGESLLTWGLGNDVQVWQPETGQLRYPPLRHRAKCHDIQFSPDGKFMVLASYDGSVRVCDLATGTVIAELPAHPDNVYSASFSPDGGLLVTSCRDRTVRVWDWRSGRLVCPQLEHTKDTTAAAFTPDGRWVLSVSVDGTARAWDWRTGKPVTPRLTVGGEPLIMRVTPDGKHAIVGGEQPALALLDLGELARTGADLDALRRWAELLAGQQLHEGGGTVNLSAAEWLDRWRALARSKESGSRPK